MPNPTLTIGFSGKRIITSEQEQAIRPALREVLAHLVDREQKPGEQPEVICVCAMAEGGDTLFAEAALEMGFRVVVRLPFEEAEYRKDFSPEGWARYEQVMAKVKAGDRSEFGSIAGPVSRNDLYLETGVAVMEETEYLVAVWDGTPGKPGGTGDVVRCALEYNEEQLDKKGPMKKLAIINYRSSPAEVAYSFEGVHDKGLHTLPLQVFALFAKHDSDSISQQGHYGRIWMRCLRLGLFAAIAFSIAVSFESLLKTHGAWVSLLLSGIELGMVAAILMIIRKSKPKHLHSSYLLNRYIAEQLRVLKVYFWAGIALPPRFESAIFKQVNKHHGWNREVLRGLRKRFGERPLSDDPEDYRREPILALVQDQGAYHARRYDKNRRLYHAHQSRTRVALWVFVGMIALHFVVVLLAELKHHWDGMPEVLKHVVHVLHDEPGKNFITLIAMLVTAWLARAEATKVFRDWEKLELESKAMTEYFIVQKEALEGVENKVKKVEKAEQKALPGILHGINREMFYENLDWQITMVDKEPPKP